MSVKCEVCSFTLEEPFTHFIKYEGKTMCETCFFNIAVDKLGATPMQLDYRGDVMEPGVDDFSHELSEWDPLIEDLILEQRDPTH